jgi:hypothetical protein
LDPFKHFVANNEGWPMKDDVTPTDKPTRTTNGEGPVLDFAPWLNGNHAFESWAQSGTNMVGPAPDFCAKHFSKRLLNKSYRVFLVLGVQNGSYLHGK